MSHTSFPVASPAFARQGQLFFVALTFIELHAEIANPLDVGRRLMNEHVYALFIAKARSRVKRISHMLFRRIVLIERYGDPALRKHGIADFDFFLRDDRNIVTVSQFQRRIYACDSAADDQNVRVRFLHFGSVKIYQKPSHFLRLIPAVSASQFHHPVQRFSGARRGFFRDVDFIFSCFQAI